MLKTKQYFFIILPVIFLMLNCKKKPPEPTTFKVLSVNPTSALPGDWIDIETEGYPVGKSSVVYFNNTVANEHGISHDSKNAKDKIRAKVPYEDSGEIKILLEGKTYIATSNFTILPLPEPIINEVSPTSAKVGDQVFIKGNYFSYKYRDNTSLFLGDVKLKENYNGDNEIYFYVPENAKTGKIKLSVNGKIGTSMEELIIY